MRKAAVGLMGTGPMRQPSADHEVGAHCRTWGIILQDWGGTFFLCCFFSLDKEKKQRKKKSSNGIMIMANNNLDQVKFFGAHPFFQGAEPSAAYGRCSEAQHGQNNEKSNVVQISIMFCTWSEGSGFQCIPLLSRLLPLLLHQQLVRHKGDEFTVGGLVVLSVDVVAEEGVEVLDAQPASRSKRLVGLLVALFFTGLSVTGS